MAPPPRREIGLDARLFWPIPIVFALTAFLLGTVGPSGIARFLGIPEVTPPPNEAADLGFFAETYHEAHTKFVNAAKHAQLELRELVLDDKDPNGKPLVISVAVKRASGSHKPKRILVHSSGVHGVELFAGSAIQTSVIMSDMTRIQLQPGDVIVFIHAVNPYGAAWLRRWNENNVDLNRNCMTDEIRKTVDGYAHPVYKKLNDFLNPTERLSALERVWFFARGAIEILRYGMRDLKDSLVTGQWIFPNGLWYGGRALEKGPEKVFELLSSDFVGLNKKADSIETVVHIDVHTGLGPFGLDTIMTGRAPSTLLKRAFPGASYTSNADPAELGISYDTKGDFAEYGVGDRLVPAQARFLPITQEFGTLEGLINVSRLRAESALVQSNPKAAVTEPEKIDVLRAFYPTSQEWRKRVLERGETVFRQALVETFMLTKDK